MKKVKTLPALNMGDVVDVIAPASACPKEELVEGLRFIENLGFKAHCSKDLLNPDLYFSNTLKYRWNDLRKALYTSKSRAIWCTRGGYSSMQLLPFLAKLQRPKRPKIFLGLSDITSLHTFLNQVWGWPTYHSPVLSRFGGHRNTSGEAEVISRLLTGQYREVNFNHLTPLNDLARRFKSIEASVVGGNLMTLQSTLGTPWQINADKKILFIEECNERGYRLHRMLEHMKQCRVFEKTGAIVLGDFILGNEPDGRNLVAPTLERFAAEINVPVFQGVPSGHGSLQLTVPFNTPAHLSLKKGLGSLAIKTLIERVES